MRVAAASDSDRLDRLELDILYDTKLSADERVARIANSPRYDAVRDGRGFMPWPEKPEATNITLTPVELRNLLEVSWRDGNGLPERHADEWPETMRTDVDRTIAEIDRWKVEGVPKSLYPEESRCPCGVPYSQCCDEGGATEEECPTYGS